MQSDMKGIKLEGVDIVILRRYSMKNEDIEKIIAKASNEYNKYRGSEARARVLNIKNNEVTILFEGSFCVTCGVYDWIEDFKYVLREMGINAEIKRIIEPKNLDENWRVAIFEISS